MKKRLEKIGKKAEMSFVIAVILSVIILIVLIFLLQKLNKGSEEALDYQICRNTVLARSVELVNIPILEKLEANCPTTYTKIKKESQEEIKRELLNSRRDCHYKLAGDKILAGEADPFNDNKVFCVVCEVFEFEQDKKIEGLGKDFVIQEIATGNVPLDKFEELKSKIPEQEDLIEIKKGDRYASLFVLYRGKDVIEELGPKGIEFSGWVVVGGGVVAVLGGYITVPIAIITVAGGGLIATYGSMAEFGEPQLMLLTPIVKFNKEELQELGCKEFPARR